MLVEVVRGAALADSHDGAVHPLTPLDNTLFLRMLAAPRAFFYKDTLDPALLKSSLARTLDAFPLAAGRVMGASTSSALRVVLGGRKLNKSRAMVANNAGVQFTTTTSTSTLVQILADGGPSQLPYQYPPRLHEYSKGAMPFVEAIHPGRALGGKEVLVKVKLTQLAGGGSILGVTCHHSLLDGRSFGAFMLHWSRQYHADLAAAAIQRKAPDINSIGLPPTPLIPSPPCQAAAVQGLQKKQLLYSVMQQASGAAIGAAAAEGSTSSKQLADQSAEGRLDDSGSSNAPADSCGVGAQMEGAAGRVSISRVWSDNTLPRTDAAAEVVHQHKAPLPSSSSSALTMAYVGVPPAPVGFEWRRAIKSSMIHLLRRMQDKSRARWMLLQQAKEQGSPAATAAAVLKSAVVDVFTVRTVVVHIPAADVARLKAVAGFRCGSSGSAVAFVSTNDALSAWVWLLMCYLRKRPLPGHPRPAGSPKGGLTFTLDLRTTSSTAAAAAKVPMEYWGNAAVVMQMAGPPSPPSYPHISSAAAGAGADGAQCSPAAATAAKGTTSKLSMAEWEALCSNREVLEQALAAGAELVRASVNGLRGDPLCAAKLLQGVETGVVAPPLMELLMYLEAYELDATVNNWSFLPIREVQFTGAAPIGFWGAAGIYPPYSCLMIKAYKPEDAGGFYMNLTVPDCMVKTLAGCPVVQLLTPGATMVTKV